MTAVPGLACRAFAKINLRLHILGTRPDGFHELDTTFQTIDLYDDLVFDPTDGPLVLAGTSPELSYDPGNLVWRAAAALWEAGGRTGAPGGVAIRLVKRIPLQAGLGGGSSDAAVTLRALARLWDLRLPPAALEAIGRSLGSDVPFFFVGGTARARGRGDVIEALPDPPARPLVLVVPARGVSTVAAYRWWDEDGPAGRAEAPAGAAVWNDFEAAVGRRHPEIPAIRTRLIEAGAEAAAMSGSGSAVFGLFRTAVEARGAAARLREAGLEARATSTLSRAAFAVRSGLV